MNYKQFYNRSIFVDANAVIYHLQGYLNSMSEVYREIFRLSELRKLNLLTTTRIIDEVIHKTLLINAINKFGIEGQVLKKLKKDKDKLKSLANDIKVIWDFLKAVNMDVKTISYNDLIGIPEIMSQYGLFGNDCLILLTMIKHNLIYLLSSDSDFECVEWVKLVKLI